MTGTVLEHETAGLTWRATALALVGLAVTALAARLFGMGQEDPWFDEVLSVRLLDQPDFDRYLRRAREGNYPIPPLYFATLWGWTRALGDSIVAARLLSVVAGTLSVIGVYALGRALFHHRVGLVAGGVMALHGYQIHYSQEIRPYALTVLFAVGAMVCLVHFIRTRRVGWLVGNTICAIVMFWLQPISGSLFVAEGLILVSIGRVGWRWVAIWAAARVLGAATLVPWIRGLDPEKVEGAVAWQRPLTYSSAVRIPFDWFGARFHTPTNLIAQAISPWEREIAYGCLAAVGLACVWGLAMPFVRARTRGETELGERRATVLLLLWFVVPVVIVAIYSLVVRPGFYHRYLMFVLPAVYLALAGGVCAAPGRVWRGGAFALLALVLGYQLVMTEPGPTRAPWSRLAADMANAPDHGIAAGMYPSYARQLPIFYKASLRESVTFLNDDKNVMDFLYGHLKGGVPVQVTLAAPEPFVGRFVAWLDTQGLPYQRVEYACAKPVPVFYVGPPGYDLAALDLASWTQWRGGSKFQPFGLMLRVL